MEVKFTDDHAIRLARNVPSDAKSTDMVFRAFWGMILHHMPVLSEEVQFILATHRSDVMRREFVRIAHRRLSPFVADYMFVTEKDNRIRSDVLRSSKVSADAIRQFGVERLSKSDYDYFINHYDICDLLGED